jgi:hypothetical protein
MIRFAVRRMRYAQRTAPESLIQFRYPAGLSKGRARFPAKGVLNKLETRNLTRLTQASEWTRNDQRNGDVLAQPLAQTHVLGLSSREFEEFRRTRFPVVRSADFKSCVKYNDAIAYR